MIQDIKCLFGMHQYDIYSEESIKDPWGNVIGKSIICICKHCGRCKEHKSLLVYLNGRPIDQ